MRRLAIAAFCAASGIAASPAPIEAGARFNPFDVAGIDRGADARAPLDSRLYDSKGRPTTLRQLASGKPFLLVPVQHRCKNICGVTLAGLFQAIANQRYKAGADFEVVAVSFDPDERPAAAAETEAKLASTVEDWHRYGIGFHAVVAENATALASLMRAIGYRYAFDPRIDQFAHVAATAVLARDGRVVRWLYGLAPQPSDVTLALTAAGEGRIGSIGDQLLLLCYRYDPETGRYTSLVWSMIRFGGIATIVLLGAFVGVSIRREHRKGAA